MSLRHAAVTDFFRNIARDHQEIKHTPTESHFARIIVSEAPWKQLVVDEFLNALKSKIKPPFLLYEASDIDYRDNGGDNRVKLFHPAFIIMDKAEKGNYNAQEAVLDKTERIGEEIMAFIVWSLRRNLSTNHIDINSIYTEKIGPAADGFSGTRFNFEFTVTANNILKYNPGVFVPGGSLPPADGGGASTRDYSPLDTKFANYVATDADSFRIIPFDCSAGELTCYVPSAIGRKSMVFKPEKIDTSENKLNIISLGGSPQINFGFPLACYSQGERQKIQSNNLIYLPY